MVASIICTIVLSALVALLGRNRNIGYGWSLILCLFLSPIIGLIIILCSKRKKVEFTEINSTDTKSEDI